MKKDQYKWVVFFISLTILITIAAQVYTNIKHYETSKHLLYKQVHFSFNKAIDSYFENIAKGGFVSLTSKDEKNKTRTETVRIKDRFSENAKAIIDSTLNIISQTDSTKTFLLTPDYSDRKSQKRLFNSENRVPKHLEKIISKVYISYSRDTLDLKKLDKTLQSQFKRHHIKLTYALTYKKKSKKGKGEINRELHFTDFPKKHARIDSNSPYFKHRGAKLTLHYKDETELLLRRSMFDILFSLILSISIVSCLLYLLYTINKQKKIAVIKNDFISNITHEFKTPIATISAALEGVKNFNKLNDTSKTEKYLDISSEQLVKLNKMVEKLLDTATLHTDELKLNKTEINLVNLIEQVCNKHRMISANKTFNFSSQRTSILTHLDIFHFENTLDNILDNAVKYGGKIISTKITVTENNIVIKIKDDGIGIPKNQTSKIFDQFYRVQKGNIHDTKGFGIGLYYAKKIIEKHNGNIYIDPEEKSMTTFTIILPL